MTLADLAGGESQEAADRFIVPFWNWSSISVVGEREGRLVLNETGDSRSSDVDCSDFLTVP